MLVPYVGSRERESLTHECVSSSKTRAPHPTLHTATAVCSGMPKLDLGRAFKIAPLAHKYEMAQLLSKVTELVQRTPLPMPSPLGMTTPAAGNTGNADGSSGGSSGLVSTALGGSKAAFAPGLVEWLALADRMHYEPLIKACMAKFRSVPHLTTCMAKFSSVPHLRHFTACIVAVVGGPASAPSHLGGEEGGTERRSQRGNPRIPSPSGRHGGHTTLHVTTLAPLPLPLHTALLHTNRTAGASKVMRSALHSAALQPLMTGLGTATMTELLLASAGLPAGFKASARSL